MRCTILIINFYSTVFLSALHVSNEPSRLSSVERRNILYYTVYYAVLLMMNDYFRFETCRADKNCGIKTDYTNCASRWSLTHCNKMHGTHNVKIEL